MPYCATPRVARSFWFSNNQMVEHMFNFDTTIFSQSFAKWKKVTRTTETAVCFIGTFMTQLIICLLWTLQCCVTAARWSFTARLRVVDNIVLIISDHVDPAYILHIRHTQSMFFVVHCVKLTIISIWCYHRRGLEYCSSGDIYTRRPSVYMTVRPRHILLLLLLARSLPAGYAAALLLYS